MSSDLRREPVERSRDPPALDQAALEALYVKLEKPMFNVVYRWLWNASDAEEVVQEAFVRVWNARARVEMATVEPLLYRTALNLASNRRRASRLWRWLGLEVAGDVKAQGKSAEGALASEETRARVRAAIEALPERLREVVVLCELSEMSHAEIAETLGIPSGTVGSRRHAALAKLRELLGEEIT